jgi:hypothetical protein
VSGASAGGGAWLSWIAAQGSLSTAAPRTGCGVWGSPYHTLSLATGLACGGRGGQGEMADFRGWSMGVEGAAAHPKPASASLVKPTLTVRRMEVTRRCRQTRGGGVGHEGHEGGVFRGGRWAAPIARPSETCAPSTGKPEKRDSQEPSSGAELTVAPEDATTPVRRAVTACMVAE